MPVVVPRRVRPVPVAVPRRPRQGSSTPLRTVPSDSGVTSAGEDEATEEDAAGLDGTTDGDEDEHEAGGVGAGSRGRNEQGGSGGGHHVDDTA